MRQIVIACSIALGASLLAFELNGKLGDDGLR